MLKTKFVLATALVSTAPLAFAAGQAPSKPGAAPFGIAIGSTSCSEAEKTLGGKGSQKPNGDWSVSASQPASLYPGAQFIEAVCASASEPVLLLSLKASKGGMGNPAALDAYRSLASKYKVAAGGPIPTIGNGYARFNDGASNVIEIEAPHMSFEFTVDYMTKSVYDLFVKRKKEAGAKKQEQKNSL